MISTDSYCPLTSPSFNGASGCSTGIDTTMYCFGFELSSSLPVLCSSLMSDVSKHTTKSLGAVGPGNWADRCHTVAIVSLGKEKKIKINNVTNLPKYPRRQ